MNDLTPLKIGQHYTINPVEEDGKLRRQARCSHYAAVACKVLAGLSGAACAALAITALTVSILFPPLALIVTGAAFVVFGLLAWRAYKEEGAAKAKQVKGACTHRQLLQKSAGHRGEVPQKIGQVDMAACATDLGRKERCDRIKSVAYQALAYLSIAATLTIALLGLASVVAFPPAAVIIAGAAFLLFQALASINQSSSDGAWYQRFKLFKNLSESIG